jgi:hypothetical protein
MKALPRIVTGRRPARHVLTRVGNDADGDGEVASDRRGLDVDLDDLRVGRQVVVLEERRVVAEPGAEREDHVGRPRQVGGDDVAARSDLPGAEGMVVGDDVAVAGRGGDRRVDLLGELEQPVGRPGPLDAGAREDERALGAVQDLGRPQERRPSGSGAGRGVLLGRAERRVQLDGEEIARDVDDNGPAPA